MNREIRQDHENEGAMQWTLWREDTYGNQYRMPLPFSDADAALAAQQEYAAKGHHQTYFTRQLAIENDVDFIPASEK